MRTSFSAVMIVFISLFLGCTTPEYTLYLQDVSMNGPISQPPVHITVNNTEEQLRISPHVSLRPSGNRAVTGVLEGHSMVDARGQYQVDTIINSDNTVSFRERTGANNFSFTGENLRWRMPLTFLGVDVDYSFSRHWALSAGVSYSSVDGQGLWGYRVGLGLFSEGVSSSIRLDAGIQWQELVYEASTVVVKAPDPPSSGGEVGFFRDRGKSSPLDVYGAFTFNTKEDWAANIFLQVAFSKQSLAKFKPSIPEYYGVFPLIVPAAVVHDMRAEFSSTCVVITPGVYVDLATSTRALLGIRFNIQTEIKESSPGNILVPFFQVDWIP